MPAIAAQGMVSLDAMLRPDTNVTAYLTTMVYVPKATRAAVRVGSAGAIKVWVDGVLALGARRLSAGAHRSGRGAGAAARGLEPRDGEAVDARRRRGARSCG